MVFVCASTQVAVNGSTTREMMDALNICLLLVLAKFTPPPHRGIVRFRRRAHFSPNGEEAPMVTGGTPGGMGLLPGPLGGTDDGRGSFPSSSLYQSCMTRLRPRRAP